MGLPIVLGSYFGKNMYISSVIFLPWPLLVIMNWAWGTEFSSGLTKEIFLSFITNLIHHVKSSSGRVAFNGYIEVINWGVRFKRWGCWIYQGDCKYGLTQPVKTTTINNAELIEVININLHLVINNRVTIMYSVSKVRNKDTDKILVPFGKIPQYPRACWVAEIWYVLIIDDDKVLNMFTVIVE